MLAQRAPIGGVASTPLKLREAHGQEVRFDVDHN